MATWRDGEKEVARLNKEISKIEADRKKKLAPYDKAQRTSNGEFVVAGRVISQEQFNNEVSAIEADADARIAPFQKNVDAIEPQLADVRAANAEIARLKEIVANPTVESPFGVSREQVQADLVAAQKRLAEVGKVVVTIPAVGAVAPSAGTAQAGGTAPKFGTPRAFEEATPGPAVKPRRKGGAGAGAGGVVTPGGGKVTPTPPVVNWEPKFREMFPAQAWLLDIDRTKYKDVFALFQKAVTNRIWTDDAALAVFQTQLQGTSFMRELAQTGKARQVKALVGDAGFDTVPFNKFLTTAMNMGWDGDTLKQEAYKEAFRKDDTGQYANPTAAVRIRKSNDFLAIKNVGTAYFSTVDDSTVENVLTGGMNQEDVQRQQREIAKGKYAHLAPLIDQGLTLEGITQSYRQRAASMLEKDINDIDMGSADFAQAFNYGEEGKKRMMGDGEWEILLRSDPRFGWRKTQNAKAEARQIASSIAQAFGRSL